MTLRNALAFYRASALVIFLAVLFLPGYQEYVRSGDNFYHVYLNGTYAGTLDSPESAARCLISARREISGDGSDYVFVDAALETVGTERLFGLCTAEETVTERMTDILKQNIQPIANESYSVKIRNYIVNLDTIEDVKALLDRAIDEYDTAGRYEAVLIKDEARQLENLNVVIKDSSQEGTEDKLRPGNVGVFTELDEMFVGAADRAPKDFEDYENGIISMTFGSRVDVAPSYIPEDQISDVETAFHDITKDREKKTVYEVKAGDTLSQIAENHGIPIDDLIAMNGSLENENSLIREGDELVVTVPEPELSILYEDQEYYEEDYEADIQYVDNNEWYTNQTQTLREPSAGHRKVVSIISFDGEIELSREIQKQEIVMAAIPKIVERGTKIPPTYLKPLSGGRLSSGFGRRRRPTRGASTFHRGLDYATPVGTAVMASSGGVVIKAGWGSGYGKVVYIRHADGRETRYGHLSRILVTAGQTVKQGQKIALSGNTGVSTGPHLHFEILINGVQVDPRKYLN